MPAEQRAVRRKSTAPYANTHVSRRCAAAFGRAGSLRTHVRTVHEKRRDHVCPQCAAAFVVVGDLNTHVRAVHENRHGNSRQGEIECVPPHEAVAGMLAADHIMAAVLGDLA